MSAVTDVIADIARIDSIEVTAGNAAPKANPVFTGVVSTAKGANIASATALTLGTDGNYFNVTGVTTITSIATTSHIGTTFKLEFDGILTLTHNATSLILPSGANITTAVGDVAEFVEISSGNFKCVNYERADGTGLVSATGGLSEVDAWNLTIATSAPEIVTTNLARETYSGFSKLGVGMSQSSGIFSFPSIGLWEITLVVSGKSNNTASGSILQSIDGSNFDTTKSASADPYTNRTDVIVVHSIFNVTSLTLCKVKFYCGLSYADSTYMIFKKLA